MDLTTFEQRAFERWESIPRRFREGVSAFVVEPGTYRKEEFEEGWVYGYCEPDEAVMAIPDAPVTSRITLFYGSFVRISMSQPEFDWEEELWETVRHELQHHLEWRAGLDHLGDEDDLQDENERRATGLSFTPDFHRWGTQLGSDAWLADGDLFLEMEVPSERWQAVVSGPLEHRWSGVLATAPPADIDVGDTDLIYVDADVVEWSEPDASLPWRGVVLVLRRRYSMWQRIKALFGA